MKKKIVFLLALSVILVTMITMHSTLAYFTTYATAAGGYSIELSSKTSVSGNETSIHEEFSAWTKHVTIENNPDSQPVYVRIRAFAGSAYELLYMDASGHWTAGNDGYYYYSEILPGGETTEEFLIRINNVPADVQDGFSFNVVVIYETTPVQYDHDGNPYADWNVKLDSGSTGTGEGGNP